MCRSDNAIAIFILVSRSDAIALVSRSDAVALVSRSDTITQASRSNVARALVWLQWSSSVGII